MRRLISIFLAAIAAFALSAPPAFAASCSELPDALADSSPGDLVLLDDEEGSECAGPFALPSHPITLQGDPGGAPELTGSETDQILFGNDVGATVIRNLTFRDGAAANDGGAIEITGDSQPTISGSSFYGNTSGGAGGAVSIDPLDDGGTVTVEDSVFGEDTDPNAAARGGALNISTAHDVVLARNEFVGNHAGVTGGGARLDLRLLTGQTAVPTVTVEENTFSLNSVEDPANDTQESRGGGLAIVAEFGVARTAEQTGNDFLDNTVVPAAIPAGSNPVQGGGGEYSEVALLSTDDRYVGNSVEGDQAGLRGGGLALRYEGSDDLDSVGRNLVAAGNTTPSGSGGGIFFAGLNEVEPPELRVLDSTVVQNEAGSGDGSGIAGLPDNDLVLHNSIVHGNSADGPEITGFGSRDIRFTDTCEDGQTTPPSGAGNICATPLLAAPLEGNVRQLAGSLTLDAGSNALVPGDLTTDYEGDARILPVRGARVDMGADETLTPEPAQSNAGGGGTNTLPPLVNTPPSLGRVVLRPGRFRAAARGASVAAGVGTRVSYRLSEAAVTRFTVERAAPGRKVRRRCAKPTARNRRRARCTRYVRVRGSFSRSGRAGANAFVFRGRLAGRKLKPGRYRLVAVAIDGQGARSAPRRTKFRIVR